MSEDEVAKAFHVWHKTASSSSNVLRTDGLEVHKGRYVFKSASIRVIGDRESGTVHRTELRVGTYRRKDFGPGFYFDAPELTWFCQDEQVERFRDFLNVAFPDEGYYLRVNERVNVAPLAAALSAGVINAAGVAALIRSLTSVPGVTEALAEADLTDVFTSAVERRRQSAGVDALRAAVEDPSSSEQRLQEILQEHWWMFGSRYVGMTARRKITLLDQFDIPLVRADGALHVVELKKACVPKLLVEHRSHNALGPEVHLAVSQAQNYLAALDRQETVIRAELGLDCRRAFATVVIGHPEHADRGTHEEISEAIRIYNSHLSRIEVLTYEDLVSGAERALEIDRANATDDLDDAARIDVTEQDAWTDATIVAPGWSDEPPF